jgi:hypothetical protein
MSTRSVVSRGYPRNFHDVILLRALSQNEQPAFDRVADASRARSSVIRRCSRKRRPRESGASPRPSTRQSARREQLDNRHALSLPACSRRTSKTAHRQTRQHIVSCSVEMSSPNKNARCAFGARDVLVAMHHPRHLARQRALCFARFRRVRVASSSCSIAADRGT